MERHKGGEMSMSESLGITRDGLFPECIKER